MKWKEFMVPTNEIVRSSVHKACLSPNVDNAQRHGNRSWNYKHPRNLTKK